MIAIDTNLLVYAHRSALRQHGAARRAIARASRDARGWGIALPSLAEFWSVVTHPEAAGRPSTPRQARDFLLALVEAGAGLWGPGERFGQRVLQLAVGLDVRGPRLFDLQIALTAFDNGATEIWTHDRRFLSVPGLPIHDPLGQPPS